MITSVISTTNVNTYGVMPYVFSTEYTALLNYLYANNLSPPATLTERIQEDQFIRRLVAEGAWAASDQIILYSTKGGSGSSLVNAKNPGTLNHTLNSTPTFVSGAGWTGNGTSQSIHTNFTPSTHGVNYTQNNAGIIFYSGTNEAASASKVEFGSANASTANAIAMSLYISTGANWRINSATSGSVANATSLGFYHFKRTSSTATALYFNGGFLANATATSSGLSSQPVEVLAYNANGTIGNWTTKQAGLWMIGSSYDGMEFNLPSYYRDYRSVPDIGFYPAFNYNWKDFSADFSPFAAYLTSLTGSLTTPITINQVLLDNGPSLVGSNKWQSWALDEKGFLYGAPSQSQSVIKFDTNTDTHTIISVPELSAGTFKYGGAIYCPTNHTVYFAPQVARSIMWVNTLDDSYGFFDTTGPTAGDNVGTLTGTNKGYGCYNGVDGRIYFVPYEATEVMIVDPSNNSISFIDTSGSTTYGNGNLSGAQKWDSGCVIGDYILGSPSDATDFVKINTNTGTVARVGSVPAGTAKWSIACAHPNGYVYIFPYYDNTVLKFDPATDTYTTLTGTIGSVNTTIKISSATVMPDGNIYASPASISFGYIVDVNAGTVTQAGQDLTVVTNIKYIGGALAPNGAHYACPFAGQYVLKSYYTGKQVSLPVNFIYNRNKSNNN